MSNLIDARDKFSSSPQDVDGGGGDGYGGGMEARLVRLETIIEQTEKRLSNIENDARETRKEVRALLYFQIASSAAILAVLAKGFGWIK